MTLSLVVHFPLELAFFVFFDLLIESRVSIVIHICFIRALRLFRIKIYLEAATREIVELFAVHFE